MAGDGLGQDGADGVCQGVELRWLDASAAAGGSDVRGEEGFVGVNIADTGDDGLIEQGGLDGAGGMTEGVVQVVASDLEPVRAE